MIWHGRHYRNIAPMSIWFAEANIASGKYLLSFLKIRQLLPSILGRYGRHHWRDRTARFWPKGKFRLV
jgi:hypothetical protein